MTKRMLIDATHAEETRVVVLDGSRLEDFDVETSTKRHLKGNIYLAKVVRVEPSLQAAFVEYGGGRHGFLAFPEIHPDYYQIPVADRQRLLDMQAEEAREEEEEEDRAAAAEEARGVDPEPEPEQATRPDDAVTAGPDEWQEPEQPPGAEPGEAAPDEERQSTSALPAAIAQDRVAGAAFTEGDDSGAGIAEPIERPALFEPEAEPREDPESETIAAAGDAPALFEQQEVAFAGVGLQAELPQPEPSGAGDIEAAAEQAIEVLPPPETVGGDGEAEATEDTRERRIPPRFLRNYKIQEVIKRRQILLVQVVKEERGTKGAALTTYISLAGRYCVLMPNSPRGGGISRKITSGADRRRLKEITSELDLPRGMGLIVRTAGANRPKPEIKRDCEYLMRLWDDIRDHTLRSVAPALIYEEASLIKRSIRDVYSRDLEEIVVDGEDGWKAAREFMRMLMPTHAKKVQLWQNGGQSLFARHQVDAQLDGMLMPTVQLRSGGYLVINQTEALVAIDVNSGRSTRERGIEETALRTNLEAADEVARQLRLRDLAGLIVIDFIDMEARKHNAMVERRLKEALKNDRARIQVGQISHFGLLEMSRQRLRPSLAEASFTPCVHCGGSGHVRSTESSAIHVLRQIEDEGAKRRSAEVVVHAATSVVMYVLNHKRERLAGIEIRHGLRVAFATDDTLIAPNIRIDRVRAALPSELPPAITPDAAPVSQVEAVPVDIDDEDDVADLNADEIVAESTPLPRARANGSEATHRAVNGASGRSASDSGDGVQGDAEAAAAEETEEGRRRRRRRRRRGGRRDEVGSPSDEPGDQPLEAAGHLAEGVDPAPDGATAQVDGVAEPAEPAASGSEAEAAPSEEAVTARGRSRRGGRRRRRDVAEDGMSSVAAPGAEQPELPAYVGPTPANPFGGQTYDIFDLMERAEASAYPAPPPAPATQPAAVPEAHREAAEDVSVTEPAVEASPAEPEPPKPAATESPIAVEPAPEVELAPEAELVGAQEAASESLVKPIMVGADAEPAAEKKRGWWRR